MFHEMSIRENLHFNQMFDNNEGLRILEARGGHNTANHALVLMLCALHET